MGPIAFDFIFVFSFCPAGRLRVATQVWLKAKSYRLFSPFNAPLFRSGANLQLYHLFAYEVKKKVETRWKNGPFKGNNILDNSE
jgi:hypothetical protein